MSHEYVEHLADNLCKERNYGKRKTKYEIPANGLHCPICNTKAVVGSYAIDETANKVEMYKTCPKCKAQWTVVYSIIPVKITELEAIKNYNDIPLK